MSVNEQNLTGRKYRVWDAANNIWKRLSFWTKASDVELNDGTTVETTLGLVKGKSYETIEQAMADLANIPVGSMVYTNDGDNYNVNASNVIYDDGTQQGSNLQTQVEALNADLSANSNHFYFDYQNGKYGYNTDPSRGAGTFSPFSSGSITYGTKVGDKTSITLDPNKTYMVAIGTFGGASSYTGTAIIDYQQQGTYSSMQTRILVLKNSSSVIISGSDCSVVAVPFSID